MTPKEIIDAASEAGAVTHWFGTMPDGTNLFKGAAFTPDQLQRFAAIIEARQREKDAGICEKISDQYNGQHEYDAGCEVSASRCAKAIREQE